MKYEPQEIVYGKYVEMEANREQLEKIDREQKAKGELLYRYISHPFADGYAFYQIVKIEGEYARIEVVTHIGDDWVLPAWGRACVISIDQARSFVERRDALAELFGNRE